MESPSRPVVLRAAKSLRSRTCALLRTQQDEELPIGAIDYQRPTLPLSISQKTAPTSKPHHWQSQVVPQQRREARVTRRVREECWEICSGTAG